MPTAYHVKVPVVKGRQTEVIPIAITSSRNHLVLVPQDAKDGRKVLLPYNSIEYAVRSVNGLVIKNANKAMPLVKGSEASHALRIIASAEVSQELIRMIVTVIKVRTPNRNVLEQDQVVHGSLMGLAVMDVVFVALFGLGIYLAVRGHLTGYGIIVVACLFAMTANYAKLASAYVNSPQLQDKKSFLSRLGRTAYERQNKVVRERKAKRERKK